MRLVSLVWITALGVECLSPSPVDGRQRMTRRDAFEQYIKIVGFTTTAVLAPRGVSAREETIQILQRQGSAVWLIGTAHVSSRSAEQVAETIDAVLPDMIAIELDRKRIGSAGGPQATAAKQKAKPGAFAVGAVLKSMYSSLDKMGFDSGAEFSVALNKASTNSIPVLLADQDVDTTLSRLAYAVSHTKPKEIAALDANLATVLSNDQGGSIFTIDEKNFGTEQAKETFRDAVEVIKQRDIVRNVVQALKSDTPEIYSALVDERDETMANNLLRILDAPEPPKRVVFVVGVAHEDGIARRLKEHGFRDDDDTTQRRRLPRTTAKNKPPSLPAALATTTGKNSLLLVS